MSIVRPYIPSLAIMRSCMYFKKTSKRYGPSTSRKYIGALQEKVSTIPEFLRVPLQDARMKPTDSQRKSWAPATHAQPSPQLRCVRGRSLAPSFGGDLDHQSTQNNGTYTPKVQHLGCFGGPGLALIESRTPEFTAEPKQHR